MAHSTAGLILASLALALPTLAHGADEDLPMLREAARLEARALPQARELQVEPGRVLRWAGGSFVQLEQRWNGLRVYGSKLRAAYTEDGALRRFVGRPMAVAPAHTEPSVTLDEARALAESATSFMHGQGQLWPSRGALAVLAEGEPTLVWAVEVSTAEPVSAWTVFVDAGTGALLGEQQALFTAQGQVYGSNPDASELELVVLPDVQDTLYNDYANVKSCSDFDEQRWECNEKISQATPDSLGDFVFEPAPLASDDPFAEVQMFWHLDLVAHWFEDRFNFRTDFGFFGQSIEGIVNFNLANAFYGDADGDGLPEVAFGQGGGVDYSYDADVVYHEFSHGVFGSVVESSNGRYDDVGRLVAPAGLNEGSADFFSLAITGDPIVGEYAGAGFGRGGDGIRNLDADRHCPTDIYGESHRDGEIWGAFGWNLIEDPALGAEAAAQIVFGALNLWGEEVTFAAAGASIQEATDALEESGYLSAAQADRVTQHLVDSGLDNCGRVIPLDGGARPRQYTVGGAGNFGAFGRPMANQYSLDAPLGTTEITFEVEDWLASSPNLEFTVYMRRGDTVLFELQGGGGGGGGGGFARPVPVEFDESFEEDGPSRIRLNEGSDPPLVAGATYYFAVMSRPNSSMSGFAAAELELSGSTRFDPSLVGDDDDDVVAGAGCAGCSSDLGRSGGAPFALLGMALLGLRRRRAARSARSVR